MPTNAPEKEVKNRTRSVAARADVKAWIEQFNELIAAQPEGVRVFVTGAGGPILYVTDVHGDGFYTKRYSTDGEANDTRSLICVLDLPPPNRHLWGGGDGG